MLSGIGAVTRATASDATPKIIVILFVVMSHPTGKDFLRLVSIGKL